MASMNNDGIHTFPGNESDYPNFFARYRVQFRDGGFVDDIDTNDLRVARWMRDRLSVAWEPRILDMKTGEVVL